MNLQPVRNGALFSSICRHAVGEFEARQSELATNQSIRRKKGFIAIKFFGEKRSIHM